MMCQTRSRPKSTLHESCMKAATLSDSISCGKPKRTNTFRSCVNGCGSSHQVLGSSADLNSNSNKQSDEQKQQLQQQKKPHRFKRGSMVAPLELPSGNYNKVYKSKAAVRFDEVSIREYEVIASDNPAVTIGAGLELGWRYNRLDAISLDKFETKRSKERRAHYNDGEKLSRRQRERILREFGATDQDIFEATKRASMIRNRRERSVKIKSRDRLLEIMEELRDSAKKFSSLCGRNAMEDTFKYGALHPALISDNKMKQQIQ